MAFSSLADLVRNYESGSPAGDYGARSSSSTASGAYQFVNGTWRNYAGQIGVNTAQYPTAASAPASIQDSVFAQAVSRNGLNDWTCPGCNPRLTNYLADNPSAASLPAVSGGVPSAGTMPAALDGGVTGGTGTNTAPGWSLSGISQWLSAGASRVGLGFLGLLLMAGALFIFANRTQIVQSVR